MLYQGLSCDLTKEVRSFCRTSLVRVVAEDIYYHVNEMLYLVREICLPAVYCDRIQ